MKKLLTTIAILICASGLAAAQNHGITLTWTASSSAAGCVSPCVGSYLVFEGPSSGNEVMTTPLFTTAALTTTDNGGTMNAYLGTTRCYVVQFQEVTSGLTLTSASSNEACFQFPTAPLPPVGLAGGMH